MNNGGNAFPTWAPYDMNGQQIADGMSLRDYFAAKALPFVLDDTGGVEFLERAADYAYRVADAMLKARSE